MATMNAFDWAMPQLTAFTYTLPRLLAMFSVLPMFNRQALPGILRMGVAGALAIFLLPMMLEPAAAQERSLGTVLAIVLKEGLIGLAMGFLFALPLWAFEAMGAMIDNQRGASVADTISPLTGHDTSPLGDLFSQAMVVYLIVSGGFLLILGAVYDSFLVWPVFDFWPALNEPMVGFLLSQFDRLMRLAVLYGAPVIIAMFMAELGLAIVSRFAPQMQVFFLAMPIKSGLAMLMFALYAQLLFHYSNDIWLDIGNDVLRDMTNIIGVGKK
ncbi:MAG: EscT/YscT/HrcT family type secretion system export apparatus protein [Paucimonas sp.]|nr:EscT/YscT/HrcT family type secretion system export apparatus protein [Paucimonas sp.]